MTKSELHEVSGVSISFLSDLTNGKANPSLKVMEAIADALDTPLPLLLESTDLDREALNEIAGNKVTQSLPEGFERISAIVTEQQAFQIKRWNDAAKKKLGNGI